MNDIPLEAGPPSEITSTGRTFCFYFEMLDIKLRIPKNPFKKQLNSAGLNREKTNTCGSSLLTANTLMHEHTHTPAPRGRRERNSQKDFLALRC